MSPPSNELLHHGHHRTTTVGAAAVTTPHQLSIRPQVEVEVALSPGLRIARADPWAPRMLPPGYANHPEQHGRPQGSVRCYDCADLGLRTHGTPSPLLPKHAADPLISVPEQCISRAARNRPTRRAITREVRCLSSKSATPLPGPTSGAPGFPTLAGSSSVQTPLHGTPKTSPRPLAPPRPSQRCQALLMVSMASRSTATAGRS